MTNDQAGVATGGTPARSADPLLDRMRDDARGSIDASASKVARLFPGALQLGLDVAVATGMKRHYVLEVNAFGDLLKDVERDGLDPYDVQVRAMQRQVWHDRHARH